MSAPDLIPRRVRPKPRPTPHDLEEIARFTEYLHDKAAMPADAFAAKWAAYEHGATP